MIDKSGWDARMTDLDRILRAERQRRGLLVGQKLSIEHYQRMNIARNAKLSAARRSEVASMAACARWYGQYDRQACPACGSVDTHFNGQDRHGKPRLRCRECRKTCYANVSRPRVA